MRIGHYTNNISCEYHMQDKMKEWLTNKNLPFIDELTIPNLGRRADFLLLKESLINIEAKCNDFHCLIIQLRSHATYCDYCFAFIHDHSLTPIWFKRALTDNGFGLIVYNYDNEVITEVLESHYNKGRDKNLNQFIRNKVYELYKKSIELNKNKQLTF